MISRRFLRIKTLQILYAYFKTDEHSLNSSEKELFYSLQKSYDLYHYLMILVLDIQDFAMSRIKIASQKHIRTYADMNPNYRFANNLFLKQLRHNSQLVNYTQRNLLSWEEEPELIRELYGNIIETEEYTAYMNNPVCTYWEDMDFIRFIYEHIFAESESLAESLENKSIYWNDDIEFVISMILKTFQKFKPHSTSDLLLLPLFQKDEDKEFAKTLIRKTILNHVENLELINQFTKNWDVERIAFMDIIAIMMAIVEVIEFPTIPVSVSMNEYIEISKYYSTAKSSNFINGVLDKLVEHLNKENKFQKIGRGLVKDSEKLETE